MAGVAKPVIYMIWPPTAPRWDELVEEDGNGVRRPRRSVGENGAGVGVGSAVELVFEVAVVWACFASW